MQTSIYTDRQISIRSTDCLSSEVLNPTGEYRSVSSADRHVLSRLQKPWSRIIVTNVVVVTGFIIGEWVVVIVAVSSPLSAAGFETK